jgi:FkbM family methyltransferase
MKVDKLICQSQPDNWLEIIVNECKLEYPLGNLRLDPNDLIIDVGANVGGFAKAWGHLSNNWYLVEPSKYNQEQIQKNLKDLKYKLFKNAVDSKSGELLKLQKYIQGDTNQDTPSGNMGTSGFVHNDNHHGWQGDYEEVKSINFKDLVGDKNVEILKVDCEGAEYNFLINMDLSNVNIILMELHNFLGKEKQTELCKWIEKTHNSVYSSGGGVGHFVKAWKRK